MSVGFLCCFNKMYFYYMLEFFRLTILELMNYNHQSKFSTVQIDSKQFLYKGFQEARNTHSSKKTQLVPGTWSRAGQIPSVPVQLIFFNSYILNTFLYEKNLAWALSFILNKIYEFFNTVNTKTLVPSLLIWSRAGPGSIVENKSP